MIPGLQNRLLDSESDNNILHIADLVRVIFFLLQLDCHAHYHIYLRFRKVLPALERTIQKVLRARFWIGSRLGGRH